ncbi:MAG: hypothetical protein WC595_06065 [Candidatus Nanoarchaeia archaeon]
MNKIIKIFRIHKAKIETNVDYTLYPLTPDPREPEEIFQALKRVASSSREPPSITFHGRRHTLMGLTLHDRVVELSGSEETSYETFIKSLDSITDIRPN